MSSEILFILFSKNVRLKLCTQWINQGYLNFYGIKFRVKQTNKQNIKKTGIGNTFCFFYTFIIYPSLMTIFCFIFILKYGNVDENVLKLIIYF